MYGFTVGYKFTKIESAYVSVTSKENLCIPKDENPTRSISTYFYDTKHSQLTLIR